MAIVLHSCSMPDLHAIDKFKSCYKYDLTVDATLLLPVDLLGFYLQLTLQLPLQLPGLKPGSAQV